MISPDWVEDLKRQKLVLQQIRSSPKATTCGSFIPPFHARRVWGWSKQGNALLRFLSGEAAVHTAQLPAMAPGHRKECGRVGRGRSKGDQNVRAR
jgi:hypothetical protein